jgi:hypothetical protein
MRERSLNPGVYATKCNDDGDSELKTNCVRSWRGSLAQHEMMSKSGSPLEKKIAHRQSGVCKRGKLRHDC